MSTEKPGFPTSSLSRRVAANWLKERGVKIAQGQGQDQFQGWSDDDHEELEAMIEQAIRAGYPIAELHKVVDNFAYLTKQASSKRRALDAMPPADGGGGDQTAIPKSGPGKAIMMKQLDQLKGSLEKGDHDGFDRGLQNLNDLFQKSTHVKAT